MGDSELLRTKSAARAALYLFVGIAVGCGRSVKDGRDRGSTSGTSAGGSAGELGGSSGSSGSGGAAQGGSAQGGSSDGGSSDGGSPQAGSAGGGGTGGDEPPPTRVFLQSGYALVATDLESLETIEVCPPDTPAQFYLVDWVNERAIFQRRSEGSTEIVRVAMDGSECVPFFRSEATTPIWAYSPAAGDRIVLQTNVTTSGGVIYPPFGLSSLSLDGSLDLITPNGVFDPPRIVGERVLFERSLENNALELHSALSDGSSAIVPVPGEGDKRIAAVRGRRLVVNASTSGDVYAVDADGGNLVALATAPEQETGFGFVGNRVIIARFPSPSDLPGGDLLIVDENGGELTPLTSSSGLEIFRGSAGDRVIYEQATDLYSVRLDGSDPRPIIEGPGDDYLLASVGEHIVYGSVRDNNLWSYVYSAADGSGGITLHEDARGFAAVAGERVLLYVGTEDNYDLVSVPITGGDPQVLSDGTEHDWLVGRVGTVLVIQRGDPNSQGEVLSIDADGSRGALIAPSARYVGSVSEECGVHRAGNWNMQCGE